MNGEKRSTPTIAMNANRAQSLSGTFVSDPLWQETGRPDELVAGVMNGSVTATAYSSVPLVEPDLPGEGLPEIRAVGDFYGDGAASVLGEDPTTGTVAVWRDPLASDADAGAPSYEVVDVLPSNDWSIAGVGDFNGDGCTDALAWNAGAREGKALLLKGARRVGTISFQPATASDWKLAGVGDFDQNGDSDVLLRDSSGTLEVLYFGLGEAPVSSDFVASKLGYTAARSGTFDAGWDIVGVGDVAGDGYASIVWRNPSTHEVGYTYFTLSRPQKEWGQLIATLPSSFDVAEVADFNGDGAADLWLSSSSTDESLIWFLDSSSSGPRGPYAQSPAIAGPGVGWQLVGGP